MMKYKFPVRPTMPYIPVNTYQKSSLILGAYCASITIQKSFYGPINVKE